MKKIEQSEISLEEIVGNFGQIAKDLRPNSPVMKQTREIREQADRRIAESGIIVIL